MGFSPEWLSLREPADLAARDPGLLGRAVTAAGSAPVILDLGCGSGSTVRTMAPLLPEGARWRLVDNDPALIARAAAEAGPIAETICMDIADLDALPIEGTTLVTASALLDLVSSDWLDALAARLRTPVYAALSYDGAMDWDPRDPRDAAVTDAFNRHQRGDKGLGPALGPEAADTGAEAFNAAGFDVARAASPWRLGPEHAPLYRALVDGIAAAATEAGEANATEWGARRASAAAETTCRIGHADLLAIPTARRA